MFFATNNVESGFVTFRNPEHGSEAAAFSHAPSQAEAFLSQQVSNRDRFLQPPGQGPYAILTDKVPQLASKFHGKIIDTFFVGTSSLSGPQKILCPKQNNNFYLSKFFFRDISVSTSFAIRPKSSLFINSMPQDLNSYDICIFWYGLIDSNPPRCYHFQ